MRSARLLAIVLLFGIAGSAASSSYTLKRGDSLGRVAAKFKIPLDALTSANNIANANKVREGLTLTVPDRKAALVAVAKPISTQVEPPPADGSKVYEVQGGDTLSGIAKRFNTSVADIVGRNGLSDATAVIREGRQLKLVETAVVPPPEGPLCPVQGADKFSFSNSFGAPREGSRAHAGNDIFAKRGTPVLASAAGTIRTSHGTKVGIGYYLDSDGGTTFYGAHMDSLRVGEGARVERGDVIGAVGTTGNALGTPAHLHFEVKPDGKNSIDPYPLLRVWCR